MHLPPLRVAFLAQYAITGHRWKDTLHPSDGVFPRYHEEILSLLSNTELSVEPISGFGQLIHRCNDFDYVFTLLNRANFKSSEIFASAICEYLQLPFLGAPSNIRALAYDKHLSKIVARDLEIPTPKWKLIRSGDDLEHEPEFPGPYIAKPRFGSASRGIGEESYQPNWQDLLPTAKRLVESEGDILIEEHVPGENLTLPFINGSPGIFLPPVATTTDLAGGIETYEQKRLLLQGRSERRVVQDSEVISRARFAARTLLSEIEPVDYARFDFRLSGNGQLSFLEFNICCNLGSHSSITMPARRIGISHEELVRRILRHSFRRQNLLR